MKDSKLTKMVAQIRDDSVRSYVLKASELGMNDASTEKLAGHILTLQADADRLRDMEIERRR